MTQTSKPCTRCSGRALATNRDRETFEYRGGHWSAHMLRHNPILAALGAGAVGISKLLPRQYRCAACGHTFSA